MKFQDIDFHIELFNANLQPSSAEIEFLNRVRKNSGYSKEMFLLKLEEAYSNLKEAWNTEYNFKRAFIPNLIDFGFPISGLNRYPPLIPFSRSFQGHLKEEDLDRIFLLINQLKIKFQIKRINKIILNDDAEFKKHGSLKPNQLENTFNSMPIEQVREHFKPLMEKENKSGEIWMTKKDFDFFIKRSFGGQTGLAKPKINLGSKGKGAIIKLFHQFYSKAYNDGYSMRDRKRYLDLLKNSFDTSIFENVILSNFKSDSKKSQYPWD